MVINFPSRSAETTGETRTHAVATTELWSTAFNSRFTTRYDGWFIYLVTLMSLFIYFCVRVTVILTMLHIVYCASVIQCWLDPLFGQRDMICVTKTFGCQRVLMLKIINMLCVESVWYVSLQILHFIIIYLSRIVF